MDSQKGENCRLGGISDDLHISFHMLGEKLLGSIADAMHNEAMISLVRSGVTERR